MDRPAPSPALRFRSGARRRSAVGGLRCGTGYGRVDRAVRNLVRAAEGIGGGAPGRSVHELRVGAEALLRAARNLEILLATGDVRDGG